MESERETLEIDWFEGLLGARVLREEAALARLALDDVFGFELLQVGAWGPSRHLLDGARTALVTRSFVISRDSLNVAREISPRSPTRGRSGSSGHSGASATIGCA